MGANRVSFKQNPAQNIPAGANEFATAHYIALSFVSDFNSPSDESPRLSTHAPTCSMDQSYPAPFSGHSAPHLDKREETAAVKPLFLT
jgi:hypothetical protein